MGPLQVRPGDGGGYQPGACNIGPAEIAARRRSGHVGVVVTIAAFGILATLGAPPITRLVVGLPAAMAAAGYLQARFRFCVAFGSAGVFNFGPTGSTEAVVDQASRSRDQAMARRIGLLSLAIGFAVGVAGAVLPI